MNRSDTELLIDAVVTGMPTSVLTIAGQTIVLIVEFGLLIDKAKVKLR